MANNEWYTPKLYIDLVKDVLGEIDLDPSSCDFAQKTVQAKQYYTITNNGLNKVWQGKVFLNPPYERANGISVKTWVNKLISEYVSGNVTEAILLVNASTSEDWFQPLYDFVICFTNGRIHFINEYGVADQPRHSNAFVYLGLNIEHFASIFSSVGTTMMSIS